jgi:hypothetical protein
MPESQSRNADNSTDDSNVDNADNKLIRQENQAPQLKGLNLPEHFIMEQARKDDLLCVLITIVLIGAAVGTFCYTRNLFSFGFLTLLPLPLSIRRRKEEAIFPISKEDYQIRLRELDIEMEKVRKQNSSVILPLLNWLKRIFRK